MKKLLAPALALSLLAGCAGGEAPVYADAAQPTAVVAYLPLDDRPVNDDRVVYLGQSLGYEMRLPDRSLYHTCLDEQETNPNGSQYGDRAALYEWLLKQEAAGCDRYVISLDQLLSGGLVSSRSFQSQSVTLSDGTVLTEEAMIDGLLSALDDGVNRIYLLDTVMRLAPTVGYDGWDLAGYETLRAYGMEARPTLSGSTLTVENIIAGYGLGADGQAAERDASLSDAVIDSYHSARARKLSLADHTLSAARGRDNVHFLFGVDDSAPSASIQTNEIAYLKQAVAGRGAVLSGADEMGMMSLCRMYADLDYGGPSPRVWVRYFGGSESSASSDFDHQPLTEIVAAHLAYLGLTATEGEDADLQVLVLTAPAEAGRDYPGELIDALEESTRRNIPTALMDAAKNAYGTDFQTRLVKKAELGSLLGYAGFYDLANATGITLANAAARWMCLSTGTQRSLAQEQAFLRTLVDSLIKDICYKNDAKITITRYVRDTLGGDPDNFARTGTDTQAVLAELGSLLSDAAQDVLKNLNRSNILTSLSGDRAGISGLAIEGIVSPWQRVFEIRMELTMDPFTAPHGLFF